MPRTIRGEPPARGRRVALDGAHGRHVVGLDDPAQGIHQQVLGELAFEQARAAQQRVAQAGRPAHRRAVAERARGIDRLAAVLGAPQADHVVVLEGEADRVHGPVTGGAGRVLAVLLEPRAHRHVLHIGGVLLQRRNVGRGLGRRRAQQHVHHPLAAQHRRSAIGVRGERQHAGVAEQAAAVVVGHRHFTEAMPEHVGQAVVARQPVVHEGVVGGKQLGDRPVLADDVVEEQLRLARHRRHQVHVEVGILIAVGPHLLQVLQVQPVGREVGRKRLGARVGEHPPHLLLEHRRVAQLPGGGQLHQFLVRVAAPQEEREPRRQVQVREAVDGVGRHPGRLALEAEDEVGAGQNGLHGGPDAVVEAALLAAADAVHAHQTLNVVLADWPAVGLARQPGDDGLGTGQLVGLVLRRARQDAGARRALGQPGHRVRTVDGQVAQMRQGGDAGHVGVADIDQALLGRLHDVVDRAVGLLDECRRDALRAGLDLDLGGAQVGRELEPRRDVEQRRLLAVDRDLDLLRTLQLVLSVEHRQARVVEAHTEDVFAVHREVVHDRDAAARAERRALDVAQLRHDAGQGIGGHAAAGLGIAHGQAADAAGGAHVALDQRLRGLEHVGHVGVAAAHLVGRQQPRDVGVHAEQIAHGVGVLGAVHAVQFGPPRPGAGGGGLIDARFEHRGKGLQRLVRGTARPGRRHQPGAQLENGFFEMLGILGGLGEVNRAPVVIAGLDAAVMAAGAVGGHEGLLRFDRRERLDRGRRGSRRPLRMGDGHAQHGSRHSQQSGHLPPAICCVMARILA